MRRVPGIFYRILKAHKNVPLPILSGGKVPFLGGCALVGRHWSTGLMREAAQCYAVSDEADSALDDYRSEDENVSSINIKKTTKEVSKKILGPKKVAIDSRPVEEIYQKKTQLEHILLRPDTYIGSVERQELTQWVYDKAMGRMVQRTVSFVPGLFKIFDEILVNAADNKMRDPSMDTLRVDIDRENNRISVYNNGRGIPIEVHSTEKVYVPELIFGQLLTSSNYDDAQKKVTGGRNGYGAKLCNIFSQEFTVETADSQRRKKYKQTFSQNMSKRGEPIIGDYSKEDFTKIVFTPDLAKFGMSSLDDDIVALLERRVYDMAGCVRNVKVYLNGERIAIKSFKDYVSLFMPKGEAEDPSRTMESAPPMAIPPTIIVHERLNDRWEVCVAASEGSFQHMSFVNSICTYKGGMHVNYITDQLTTALFESLKKKHKDISSIKPAQIKNHLSIFINCLIENPTFDSQTKEYMTLRSNAFGSKCILGEEYIKKVLKCGIVENVVSWAKFKQVQQLKKTDGVKRTRLSGITKLDDANNAGTKNASKCTLIITEGDSAKALAVSGLGVVGRDNYGVFPLRGKLLNVREASHKQILENQEINYIKQILGLQHGQVYTSIDTLRYGSLMIMTDQDHDGSHIKGLVINFLDHFFPSLLKIPGFLVEFITPIVKATRGREEISFYTIPEYEAWKAANNGGRGWHTKYYKGLGTSTAADARKYFAAMDRHRKVFSPIDGEDRRLIDMAFSKKRADERKEWLKTCTSETFMDTSGEVIQVKDFINKELILFSMADNIRSIPSVIDGLKPGHRKILFSCFKRKLRGEIKVAQLAGYVSEHSAYHHGEQSLCATIIGMAQNFVGSNNVNLLEPIGQFGTRLQGGKDAASPRYVFTSLSPFARLLFRAEDDALLEYLTDDGQSIEPKWYIPILPLVLVNGGEGIGTGWMTTIPNYNPRDVANNLERMMDGSELLPMHPWYHGFNGTVEPLGTERYRIVGRWRKVDATTLEISELPIGTWTQTFKEMLEGMLTLSEKSEASIKDYKEYHTDTTVCFIISLSEEGMRMAEAEGIEKRFKLSTALNLNNIVCFDPQGRLRRYTSPLAILEEFYHLRLQFYVKRKDWMAEQLTREWTRLDNRVRFVKEIIAGSLIVQNRKKAEIIIELKNRGYVPTNTTTNNSNDDDNSLPEEAEAQQSSGGEHDDNNALTSSSQDYDYLLNMPIYNLTREKVEKLQAERDAKEKELDRLLGQTPKDLWRRDLGEFLTSWDLYESNAKILTEKAQNKVLPGNNRKTTTTSSVKKTLVAKQSTITAISKKSLPDSDFNEKGKKGDAESFIDKDDDEPFTIKSIKQSQPRTKSLLNKNPKSTIGLRETQSAIKTSPIDDGSKTEIDPSSVGRTTATVQMVPPLPAPLPAVMSEEELNNLPLTERINYMLQSKHRQTTLDLHFSKPATTTTSTVSTLPSLPNKPTTLATKTKTETKNTTIPTKREPTKRLVTISKKRILESESDPDRVGEEENSSDSSDIYNE